jgi:uncharacterized membrane protein YoaK (UPF0700 family)
MAARGAAESHKSGPSLREPLPRVLLALSFTTGLIDAVSYLGLGRVFTANMTGNVVLLGFGITGTGGLPVISPLVSALAFLVGALGGGMLATRIAQQRRRHVVSALGIEVAFLLVAAGLAAIINVRANTVSGDSIVALLALAMGVRNATVRKLSVPDLTTTVLTMTLTGLAADSPLAGGSGRGAARRLAAVGAIGLGAIAGALMVRSGLVLPLLVAAALAAAGLVGYARAREPEEPPRAT